MTYLFTNSIASSDSRGINTAALKTRMADDAARLARSYISVELPRDLTYARIVAGGKVLATITNSGVVLMRHQFGRQGQAKSWRNDGSRGPELAQQRAEELAKTLEGSIERAKSAQAQHEWQARPTTQWRIDHVRMSRDGYLVPQDYHNLRFRSAEAAEHSIRALMEYQSEAG
jgi:hypothetical protein